MRREPGEEDDSFGSAAKSGGLDLGLEFQQAGLAARRGGPEIEASKLLRACGGCLGAERR